MKDAIIDELEYLLNGLYQSDDNYKHADTTTGQRCYEEHEIKDLIKEVIKEW